ncbi:MAG: 50S ribosomal protein L27 [Candidatus Liptonbacteria bacterium]
MAHTKAGGSTKLGRDSVSKRLGVKIHDGEKAEPGQIIIRQRGTRYLPGRNVGRGGDDTLFALKTGVVRYSEKTKTKFDGSRRKATVVTVKQSEVAAK